MGGGIGGLQGNQMGQQHLWDSRAGMICRSDQENGGQAVSTGRWRGKHNSGSDGRAGKTCRNHARVRHDLWEGRGQT